VITVLAGGVGAARFLLGLMAVAPPERVTAIVNTADDIYLHGLRISPDVDTVTYTLAGLADAERGWGIAGDTFRALAALRDLGAPDCWFQLGDRDLATHVHRTALLAAGRSLTQATGAIAAALGVRSRVLPMTDQLVTTRILTDAGELHFQEYFVREACRPRVRGIRFEGLSQAYPSPEVLEAVGNASLVIIAPSNPVISIGPILALPGMRDALRAVHPVVAVTPLIGGRAVKGPTVPLMQALGLEAQADVVARLYADFLTTFVLDETDASRADRVHAAGVRPAVAQTLMATPAAAEALARAVLDAAGQAA